MDGTRRILNRQLDLERQPTNVWSNPRIEAVSEVMRCLENLPAERMILWTTITRLSSLMVTLPPYVHLLQHMNPFLHHSSSTMTCSLTSLQGIHPQTYIILQISIPASRFTRRPHAVLLHHSNNTHRVGAKILNVTQSTDLFVLNTISISVPFHHLTCWTYQVTSPPGPRGAILRPDCEVTVYRKHRCYRASERYLTIRYFQTEPI